MSLIKTGILPNDPFGGPRSPSLHVHCPWSLSLCVESPSRDNVHVALPVIVPPPLFPLSPPSPCFTRLAPLERPFVFDNAPMNEPKMAIKWELMMLIFVDFLPFYCEVVVC